MMLVKIHEEGKVVALCDDKLIGQKFEHDGLQLDITERFYGGEDMDKEKVMIFVNNASTINIVGEESIKFGIENDIITKDHVIYVGDVPHAQMFRL